MDPTAAALAGLAISAFTSATLLPGTSEVSLAALHIAGLADGWLLLAVASLANVAGSCVNWVLGRFAAQFAGRSWFPISAQAMERAQGWYRRYGAASLLLSWVPVIGDPLTLAAGVLRVPFAVFLVLVALAKTARYTAVLWLVDLA